MRLKRYRFSVCVERSREKVRLKRYCFRSRQGMDAQGGTNDERGKQQEVSSSSPDDGYVIVSEADAEGAGDADSSAARAPIVSGAFDTSTCGICLEPAGSKGVVPDSDAAAQTFFPSPINGVGDYFKKMRMRRNARRLACGHTHCATCWAGWIASQVEEAASRRVTLKTVRCPLCNVESLIDTHTFLQLPQAANISSLLRKALHPTTARPAASTASRQPEAAGSAAMRPLASTRQEEERRARTERQRAAGEARRDAEEIREYNEVKQEHGAIAASYEYCRLRSVRLASPWMKKMEQLPNKLAQQAREARRSADAACEAAWTPRASTS